MSAEVTDITDVMTDQYTVEDDYEVISGLANISARRADGTPEPLSIDKGLSQVSGLGRYVLQRLQDRLAEGASQAEAVDAVSTFYYLPKSYVLDMGRSALTTLASMGFGLEHEPVKELSLALGLKESAPLQPDECDTAGLLEVMEISSETELSERARILRSGPDNAKLNDTESRILELVTIGLDKPAIAKKLGLAENSVKAGFSAIYRKYGLDYVDRRVKPSLAKKIALDILIEHVQDKTG